MADDVQVTLDGHTFHAPLLTGSEGERAFDISKLRSETGLITYDPGFGNTGAVQSEVTFVDGVEAILRHRGYAIDDLVAHSDFMETSYLLIHGDLPDEAANAAFRERITRHTLLREDMRSFFDAFPHAAHPMGVLQAGTSALSTFYQDALDPRDPEAVELSTYRLLAKLPTIAAFAYKHAIGQPYIYPRNDLDYVANFLNMLFAVPSEPYDLDPVVVRALDMLLILHADHEQNCSASTVRLVGSSQANLFASVSAGIGALWGPLHGGANQKVVEMLEQIRDADESTESFIARAKDKQDSFRLMGFGHRVYKNYDPRARLIKATADEVIAKLVGDDPLFEIAARLEEAAMSDDYFIERKLYPNVDFYSGLIYRAMGIPVPMFPVLFAIGRLPGWIAQWREMLHDPDTRIGRPRQIYTGKTERPYPAAP